MHEDEPVNVKSETAQSETSYCQMIQDIRNAANKIAGEEANDVEKIQSYFPQNELFERMKADADELKTHQTPNRKILAVVGDMATGNHILTA